ncbi:MAG: SPOR domain-containing protein [Pseudomonadota bacterium]
MPVADKDIQEPGSNATEALPSGDVNRTTDASAPTMGQAADPEKPPLAVAMPSPSAGLASASGQADWLARSEGEPLGAGQSESAAEQAVGLYEVERPTGAFYTLAVAEFAHLDSAHALKNDLETQFIEAEVFASGSMAGLDWYTVAVGRFADRFDADRQGRRLSAAMGRQLSPMLLRVAAR